jgi:hypothetical protein
VAGNQKKENTIRSKPAHKIRNGVLQVTIWRNSGDKGSWYSVTSSRSYKQGDETWKETDSLNFDDLLPMSKLLDLAHTWIMHQQQADQKARKDATKDAA